MASASNTELSLPKKTHNGLAPCPPIHPMVSSAITYNPDIVHPLYSYATPVLLSNYPPSKPLAQKPLSIESIDRNLDAVVQQKLVYLFRTGGKQDTLHFHRRHLMEEIKQKNQLCGEPDQDFSYRDQLITLLSSTSKIPIRNIPVDLPDWFKILTQWIKSQLTEDIIFNREIYEILAVDGFYGFKPKDLKHYLTGVLHSVRKEYKIHMKGVRAMYRFISKNSLVTSLPGTDSACVVFLALLNVYKKHLTKPLFDYQLSLQIQSAQFKAEGFLHAHSDTFRDIQHVDEPLLDSIATVYLDQFPNPETCTTVSEEIVKLLSKVE